MPFKTSAPGSLMLLGEYAVLAGKPALLCAVNQRIHVTLTPRLDDHIEIQSPMHGHYATTLPQLSIEKPFHFVLGTLKYYQTKLKRGCNIDITADFSDQVGLGSSAAVTVASLAALIKWLNIRVSPLELVRQGREVVRRVQGVGSGADIAASVYGGLVCFQARPLSVEKFPDLYPITALYAGYKTPTVEAIQQVQQRFTAYPSLLPQIHNTIGQCVLDGIQVMRKNDWAQLGEIMKIQQGLMEALGVSSPLLRSMVENLSEQPNILGTKISGAGLGDCVIGLGALSMPYAHTDVELLLKGVQPISLEMTALGVQGEKI